MRFFFIKDGSGKKRSNGNSYISEKNYKKKSKERDSIYLEKEVLVRSKVVDYR